MSSSTRKCDHAVNRARRELPRVSRRFSSVFWYGAVDIAREHLMVWVLLSGTPSSIPEWYNPRREDADPRFDAALLAEIDAMRDTVVACFAREGWPDAELVDVGFESATRVEQNGGWHYFK